MNKVSESIFDGKTFVIPMADVSHIEKKFILTPSGHEKAKGYKEGDLEGIKIILKNTTYNSEQDEYNNDAWLYLDEAKEFLKAWCFYRHELEK